MKKTNTTVTQKIKIAVAALSLAAAAGQVSAAENGYVANGLAGLRIGGSWAEFTQKGSVEAGKCKPVAPNPQSGLRADQDCDFVLTTGRNFEGKALDPNGSALLFGGNVVGIRVKVALDASAVVADYAAFMRKVATWWGRPHVPGNPALFISTSKDELNIIFSNNPRKPVIAYSLYVSFPQDSVGLVFDLTSAAVIPLAPETPQR